MVVEDLSEVTVEAKGRRSAADLPSALARIEAVRALAAGRRPAFFLDYDGTLTPIVERPDLAVLAPAMRAVLARLARRFTVAVVSGRGLDDVRALVDVPELIYAGSHGFEIAGPEGLSIQAERGTEYLPALDAMEAALRRRLAAIEGALVERKRFSIAVHYRLVAARDQPALERAVAEVLGEHAGFRKGGGKKVYEIQPDIDWHKGRAVRWLIEALELDLSQTPAGLHRRRRHRRGRLRGAERRRPGHPGARRRSERDRGRFRARRAGGGAPLLRGHSGGGAVSCWSLVYRDFAPESEGLREALCTLGNGHFAVRGAADEMDAGGPHYPGTYLAGGYNRLVSEVSGREVENEDLVNFPNWLPVSFRHLAPAAEEDATTEAPGPWFDLHAVEILDYRQELDMADGLLHRRLRVRDSRGRVSRIESSRLVSMDQANLAAQTWSLVPENWGGPIELRAALDGRVVNGGVARYRNLRNRHLEPGAVGLEPDGPPPPRGRDQPVAPAPGAGGPPAPEPRRRDARSGARAGAGRGLCRCPLPPGGATG